jgi:hypothetical protein
MLLAKRDYFLRYATKYTLAFVIKHLDGNTIACLHEGSANAAGINFLDHPFLCQAG